MNTIELILAERNKQQKKGYTAEHDDEETNGQIAKAAAVYACPPEMRDGIAHLWEWSGAYFKPDTTSTTEGRIKELVKAAALICAEIERLDRICK